MFLGELKKVLPAVNYDINSEYVKEAYVWFKKQLKDHYTLSIDERNNEEYKHFLEDETKYICEEKRKLEAKEKRGTKYVTQLERVRWLYLGQVC